MGAWESVGELHEALNAGAAQTFGDHVYFVGGQNAQDDPVSTIVAAALTADRHVADAHVLASRLSVARTHVHQTPMFGRWLYSVGGRDAANASLGIVDIGTFD